MANKLLGMAVLIVLFALGLMWFNSIPNWVMESQDYAIIVFVVFFIIFGYLFVETGLKN